MAKDLLSFSVGLGGIVYQQITGKVDIELLLVFGALIGLQTIAGLTTLARGTPTELPVQPSTVDSSESTSDSS